MKKVIYLILFITLFVSPVIAVTQTFEDVNEDNIFHTYILDLKNRNIVTGYNNGKFYPDKNLTRGELSKFIVKAFDLKLSNEVSNFPDVKPDNPFFNEIKILKSLKIVTGYQDGTFKPGNEVTRGEALKFVVNSIQKTDPSLFDSQIEGIVFLDVTKSNPFSDYINSSASVTLTDSTNIVRGYSDGKFYPEKKITRGEMSKIISQTLNYIQNGELISPKYFSVNLKNDSPIDQDNDGEFDEILCTGTIKILDMSIFDSFGYDDQLYIDVHLLSSNWNFIDIDSITINKGTSSLNYNISFNGNSIYQYKSTPKFISFDLVGSKPSESNLGNIKYELQNSYDFESFVQPSVKLSNSFSDEALDYDNNGLFDQLVIRTSAEFKAGKYNINALLTKPTDKCDLNEQYCDEEIGRFAAVWYSYDLVVEERGTQEIELYFDGRSISHYGFAGPFNLGTLRIYKIGDDNQNIENFEVNNLYSTKYYANNKFEK